MEGLSKKPFLTWCTNRTPTAHHARNMHVISIHKIASDQYIDYKHIYKLVNSNVYIPTTMHGYEVGYGEV